MRAAVLIVAATAPFVALAGDAPVSANARVPAAKPSGKWHCYVLANRPRIVAAGPGAIWFNQLGAIWRYDVRTKTVRAVTPLDGIDIPDTTCWSFNLGPAGQLGLAGNGAYMWTKATGWRVVPDVPQRGRPRYYDFDKDGTVWGINNRQAYRLKHGAWQLAGDIKSRGPCVRLGEGFFTWNDRSGAVDRFKYVSGDFKTHKPLGRQWDRWSIHRHSIRLVDGKLYGAFSVSEDAKKRQALAEIKPDRLIEQIRGDVVGVDITGKGFVKLTLKSRNLLREVWKVELTQGENPTDLEMPPTKNYWEVTCVRDANGHVWVNQYRWDGKEWKEVIPDNAFTFRHPAWALDDSLARLEGSPPRWRRLAEDVRLRAFNPVKRTGWRRVEPQPRKYAWEMVQIGAEGELRVLQHFPTETAWGCPVFQSPPGHWWGRGPGSVSRHTKGKSYQYPAGERESKGLNRYYPPVALSPKGNVWMRRHDQTWVKWDKKTDTFKEGDVHEDHAFKLGPLTLSVVFDKPDGSGVNMSGEVFVREAGRWEPWKAPPFDDATVAGGGATRAYRGMVRGQRILVSTPRGPMEYDGESDRWARLHDYSSLRVAFDKAGRRIMFGQRIYGLIYVYEGDPFGDMVLATEQERARFASWLAKLDDDHWRVRERATTEVRTMGLKWPGLFLSAWSREDLSVEARLRMSPIRTEILKAQANVPPALFRSVVPQLAPVRNMPDKQEPSQPAP